MLSAQIAQVAGGVVMAAPWELYAFDVPAAMCSRLVARRGRRALRAGRRQGLAVAGRRRGEQKLTETDGFLGHARVPCHMMLLTEKKKCQSRTVDASTVG